MKITLYHYVPYLSLKFPFIHRRKVETTYEGDSTVWRDVKTGKRPGTATEMQLSEISWLRKQNCYGCRTQRHTCEHD